MDSSHFPSAGKPPHPPPPPKRQLQIQGPRPAPLKVHQDSHKIKKPPRPAVAAAAPPLLQSESQHPRQPVIIYAVSPKVIHANEANFMAVVQRLTGLTSGEFYGDGDVSPAARLASTEKTSPSSEKDKGAELLMGMIEEGRVELSGIPGILSPSPASLPPVAGGFFSPMSDPHTQSILHDLSPFWYGNGGGGFMGSPSSLFSGPIHSPVLSPNLFTDLW